jgi:hypothetical protein
MLKKLLTQETIFLSFYFLRLIGELANTNVIVVVLPWPNTEPMIFCTKSEYIILSIEEVKGKKD